MFTNKATRKSRTIKYDSEKAVHSALKEISIYIVFLIVTTTVAFSSRHLYMFYFNKTVSRLFLERDTTAVQSATVAYEDLVTTADWFSFLQGTFMDSLHQNDIAADSTTEQRFFLEENLLLGPPRLRQIRVKQGTCKVPLVFRNYFQDCYAEYTSNVEDRSANFKGSKFKSLKQLNSKPIWGKLSSYVGGGFVEPLTYKRLQNEEIIKALKEKKWIDRGTRLVLVEFVLFNANTDLFDSVKFLAELLPTGGILPSANLQSLKLYNIWTEGNYWVLGASIVFYLMSLRYLYQEIMEIMRYGLRNYVRSLWNFVDVMIIILSLLSFIYNLWHPMYLRNLLVFNDKHPQDYQSLDVICYWNLVYMDLMAICAFLVWIKIFKYIGFNKTMLQFSTTLRRCSKDLFGFAVMFFIVFIAYAQLGLLLFGSTHPDFRNFKQSLITMMRMVLGDFEYAGIEHANRILGPIYFLSYILLVFFILLNMFLAIINDTYSNVKSEITEGTNYLHLFISNICQKLRGIRQYTSKNPAKKIDLVDQPDKVDISLDNASNGPETELSEGSTTPRRVEAPTLSPSKTQRIHRRDIINLFEEISQSVEERNDHINSLTVRVDLLETVLEELIVNMDHILKQVEVKTRRGGI